MKKILAFCKKEIMLLVALLAAIISLFITPPSKALLSGIDWKTLATLFMLLSVLDGFKHENLFLPVIKLVGRLRSQLALSLFLIFGVFFSSMFVTNDVSLIIFIPLTILLFRAGGKEKYILPVIVMENIAAVRGSLLTPFGSPQNLFLFSSSGIDVGRFLLMMLPLWLGSAVLIVLFTLFIYRRDLREPARPRPEQDYPGAGAALSGEYPDHPRLTPAEGEWKPENRGKRIVYLVLFAVIIACIVSRTSLWPWVTLAVTAVLLIADRRVFLRVDYVLLLTFLCFFVFSSSIAGNPAISSFLRGAVGGNEYWWSIGLSQLISNVPASIVLWPFSSSLKPLIYGLDSAGLVTIIGSLASVIALRLYSKEYPGRAGRFMLVFEGYSLCFFAVVAPLQLLLI